MLQLRRLTKRYGPVTAALDVTFDVPDGQFLTMLGPSGSGKSSVLAMIAGYSTPTSGQILLDGRNLASVPASDRGIGVVFQHYALFPHMTVNANVAYGLKRHRWPKAKIAPRVAEMLDLVGLSGFGERRPGELSGGQQQRVALARALAFEPRLLLMDEPLGALDREIRAQMQEQIRQLHRELCPTVVYVTHDRGEAYGLADRVAIMRDGCLVSSGTPSELYQAPPSRFVASFFAGHQLVDVEHVVISADGTQARCMLWDQEIVLPYAGTAPADTMSLAIFEDAITVRGTLDSGLCFQAEIFDRIHHGSAVECRCRVTDQSDVLVFKVPKSTDVPHEIGSRIKGSIDLARCRLVPRDELPAIS